MARPATRKVNTPKEARGLNERKPRAERWAELLEAAAEIFYEKGYDATSLQDIADKVGILKGSIYYYIETKADLRDNLLLEVHNDGLAMIRELADVDGGIFDKLEAMIRGHVDYVCGNLAKTTVYLQELTKLGAAERTRLFGSSTYRDVFLEVIQQGQREGMIQPDLDPKLTAQAMLGSLNSLYKWYRPSRGRPSRGVADYFVTTLLRGHATDAGLRELAKR
jgi:AcrR family transcriptional regulator